MARARCRRFRTEASLRSHFPSDISPIEADDAREDDDFPVVVGQFGESAVDAGDLFGRARRLAGCCKARVGRGELVNLFGGVDTGVDTTRISPLGSMKGVFVDELSQSGCEEPCAEGSLAAVLKARRVREDFAHDRLHDIRFTFTRAHERPGTKPNVGAQIGQVSNEQLVDGGAISTLGGLNQLLEWSGLHSSTARDALL